MIPVINASNQHLLVTVRYFSIPTILAAKRELNAVGGARQPKERNSESPEVTIIECLSAKARTMGGPKIAEVPKGTIGPPTTGGAIIVLI